MFMGMELETESYDDDDDLNDGCNDVWLSWLSPRDRPRLRPIYEKIGRSLDEILQLEIELIQEHTELLPEDWIRIHASDFRQILTDDPTLTKHQVKYLLYMK